MTDHLSSETLDELREKLERRRAELAAKSRRAMHDIHEEEPPDVGDTVDDSTVEQETSTMLELKEKEKNELTKISVALDRLSDGDYGICKSCGEPIPEDRLHVQPMAVLCVDCKQEQEEEEERRKNRPNVMDKIKGGGGT